MYADSIIVSKLCGLEHLRKSVQNVALFRVFGLEVQLKILPVDPHGEK